MRSSIILLLLILSFSISGQEVLQQDSLSLIFMGDIMGHDAQINSAFNPHTNKHEYGSVFKKISPIIESVDFAIANLELTLAGQPYTGYPRFSSPDALAYACKKNGIDVLVTANNHSCDRGKKGIVRTINVLDSLQILHTGTFKNALDKDNNNLLVLSKNNIKVGLLNYTYGTNGLPTPSPTLVNRIDTLKMLFDIQKSKAALLDKLVVIIHWGEEYQSYPSQRQIRIAEFLFKNGVDIIIGSHPHVLQQMEYIASEGDIGERLVAYSLGNFVSNQRTRKRDGGAMLKLTIIKKKNAVKIADPAFYLTWVHKVLIDGKMRYEIIPCALSESTNFNGMDVHAREKMQLFMMDSRMLLHKENINIEEAIWSTNKP